MKTLLTLVVILLIAPVALLHAQEKSPAGPQSPPPDTCTLVSIDQEKGLATYHQTYWESHLDPTTSRLRWVSKTVTKELKLDTATFYSLGGKKQIKGQDAITHLQKKLPIPLLMSRDGKPLDPFYESIYRPEAIVMFLSN